MKPSEKTKTFAHDDFVIKASKQYEKWKSDQLSFKRTIKCELKLEFEKTIWSINQYKKEIIGVADLVATSKLVYKNAIGEEKVVESTQIIEFKPNSNDLTQAVRQLRIYEGYYGGKNLSIVFCTYKEELQPETVHILQKLGCGLYTIKRNK